MSTNRRVCIGIPVQDGPELLLATLASLRAHTSRAARLVLLGDGPDEPIKALLATLPDLTQWTTAERKGTAACFNRLAAGCDADVLVLLEHGACVGPGWLDRLLAALDSDPRNGLAGPSTNRCWNEQCAYPGRAGTGEAISECARDAARRFGSSARSLAPLHSLSDFCYAVRREVVETIGAADAGFADGPCWEMDYNVRAARAGWRGVWAGAAYVWRAPWPPGRQQIEAERFEASKRRYQDNVCALRLQRLREDYEPHCRGETCEHFAPAALLTMHRPLPRRKRAAAPPSVLSPLVSCIMPTGGRPHFVLQSIRYFQQQDYANRELIILDDGGQDLAPLLPADARIRYERLSRRLSIGTKRTRACALARGSIIAQWDDDDWYAPDRLSVQVAPILDGSADITGLFGVTFFDLPSWRFWRCTPDLHARLFVGDVVAGTLLFARKLWDQGAQYPDISLAEDAYFLQRAVAAGARLARLPADGHFLYTRHGHNTWHFQCGTYLDPRGWQAVDEPELPAADLAFYRACAAQRCDGKSIDVGAPAPLPIRPADSDRPLVSCIMPTANRRRFVEKAIRYFERQTYPNRELIIVDDGGSPVGDLAHGNERIRYIRLDRPATVGAKRNLACEQARGAIIAHWDDDDWYAPHRLDYQVEAIARAPEAICGVSDLVYYDLQRRRAFRYVYPRGQRPWLAGNALCYGAKAWNRSRFREIDVGEDALFVWGAPAQDVVTLPDSDFVVAMIHDRNVSPKATRGSLWRSHPVNDVEQRLGADWAEYLDFGKMPAAGR